MVAVAWFLDVRLRVRFLSHDEIVLMAKTMTPRASADSQCKFKGGVQNCHGWRRQLIKPSVLGFRCNFLSRFICEIVVREAGGVVAWFLEVQEMVGIFRS